MNALGRLADANVAVELLTTHDLSRARILASQIEGLNAQRRLLCDQVFQAAQAQVERTPQLLEEAALVLMHPQWPAGTRRAPAFDPHHHAATWPERFHGLQGL